MRSIDSFGILTIIARIRFNDAIQITITTEHCLNVDCRFLQGKEKGSKDEFLSIVLLTLPNRLGEDNNIAFEMQK